MTSLAVVIGFDVFKDSRMRMIKVREGSSTKQLCLEAAEERFGEGIVIVVIYARHALPATVLVQQVAKDKVHVLAAAIGMDDQVCRRFAPLEGFFETADDQVRLQ